VRVQTSPWWVRPGHRARANYRVRHSSHDTMTFEAADFLTAYNVGLNEVELRHEGRRTIRYRVSFRRWNRYAVAHGALLGLILAILSALPAVRHAITRYPAGAWLFWGMVLFWGLAWPRLLTAFHRPFARAALERVLREVIAGQTGRHPG